MEVNLRDQNVFFFEEKGTKMLILRFMRPKYKLKNYLGDH